MATTIINDEGNEEVVFTQAEIEAQIAEKEAALKAEFEKQLAEKDAHVKEKLDQFQQAKKSVDIEKEEINSKVAEAMRMAEEAKTTVAQARESELNARKEAIIVSLTGNDPVLRKKIEDEYSILSLPASTPEEINARVTKAASMAGINSNNFNHNLSFSGNFAPNVQASRSEQQAAEYEAWKKELGLQA